MNKWKLYTTYPRQLMRRYPMLIFLLFLLGIGVAISEGLSMTLVIPLMQGFNTQAQSNNKLKINIFAFMFENISVKKRIQLIALLLFIITTLKGFLLIMHKFVTAKLQINVVKLFRIKCADQLLSVGMEYLNKSKSSDFFTMTGDYTKWVGTIVTAIGSSIPKIFCVIILYIILFNLSWELTIVSTVLVLFSTLALRKISRIAQDSGNKSNLEMLKLNEILFAITSGMKVIRIFNREKYMCQEFIKKTNSQGDESFRNSLANASVAPIFEVSNIFILAAILFVASILIINNNSVHWVEILLMFMVILFKLISPISSINAARVQILSVVPPVSDLFYFLQKNDKVYIQNGNKVFNILKQEIEFKNISFWYKASEKKVLDNLTLKIRKGFKVGIVGPSGCGKSTTIELLLRFYDPQEGQILIDGIDLKKFDISSWRSHIGVVSQDMFLFNKTIKENIAFPDPMLSLEEIKIAARLAHADEFINQMPKRYETVIGERGVTLSGGQKQRISIARAIVKNPKILILDEATSSLDTESEKKVQLAIDEVGKGRTVIIIAHRLSTIADANVIFVVDEGKIVESGSHEELMDLHGIYTNLINLQNYTDIS